MTSQRPRPRFPLRIKIFLLVAVFALLAIGFTTGTSTELLRSDRLAYVNDVASLVAEKLATQTRGIVASLGSRLRLYAGMCRGVDGAALQERATRELLAGDPDLVRVQLLAPGAGTPQVLASGVNAATMARADLVEVDLEGLDAAAPIPLGGDVPLVLNRSLPPATPLLTMVLPVGGGLVVVADWLPQELIQLYTRNPAYQAFLLAADGTLMVHPDAALAVQRRSVVGLELLPSANSAGVGGRGTRSFIDPDGVRQIGAFASTDVGGLAVVSYMPEQRALAAGEHLVHVALLSAAGLLVVALLAAWLFSRRITRPLERLSAWTARLAVGDYRVEVTAPGGDELGVLAQDFSAMARQLEALHAQLVLSTKLEAERERRAQAAKLESVGRLASGIAHEFNNLMATVISTANVGAKEALPGTDALEDFRAIKVAGQRAADLTRQLMAFGGRRQNCRHALDVAAELARLEPRLREMAPRVQVSVVAEPVPPTLADPGQLEDVLIQLVSNAVQAMPEGGTLSVVARPETLHVPLDSAFLSAPSGRYVTLAVSDSGTGIAPDILPRIFEPFFSTRPIVDSKGLGLAEVHGIVAAHGGGLAVETTPGRGSTFVVYLPAEPEGRQSSGSAIPRGADGSQTGH